VSFTFGRILKSNTARASRRNPLTDELKERIRKRVVGMLEGGYRPREYRQYAKLARKIGPWKWLAEIKERIPIDNPWAQHYSRYFEEHGSQIPALKRLVADTEAGKVSCAADGRPSYSFSLIVQRRDRSLSQLN